MTPAILFGCSCAPIQNELGHIDSGSGRAVRPRTSAAETGTHLFDSRIEIAMSSYR